MIIFIFLHFYIVENYFNIIMTQLKYNCNIAPMKTKSIVFNTKGLKDTEVSVLEVLQLKFAFKRLGITNIWSFFKLDYPNYDVNDFRAKINSRTITDKDFLNKLRAVYNRQKR